MQSSLWQLAWGVEVEPVPKDQALRDPGREATGPGRPSSQAQAARSGIEARDRVARHFKKGRRVLCQGILVKYAFIKDHGRQHAVRTLCRVLKVHPSGYYVWKHQPQSARTLPTLSLYKFSKALHLNKMAAFRAPIIRIGRLFDERCANCPKWRSFGFPLGEILVCRANVI